MENENDTCETCGGDGKISAPGYVYPGEPHIADIETQPCPDCTEESGDEDY